MYPMSRPPTTPLVRIPLTASPQAIVLTIVTADWNALCPAYNRYTSANQIAASGPAALVPAEIPNPKPITNSSIPS